MTMSPKANHGRRLLDSLLVTCAVLLTAVTLYRFFEPKQGQIVKVKDRDALDGAPRSLGASTPKRSLVVFTDYECPACQRFDVELDSLLLLHGDSVRVVIRHFPAEAAHPFALRAAMLAECATQSNTFPSMHHALFRSNIGIDSSWEQKALASIGEQGQARLKACAADSTTIKSIRKDVDLGRKIGVRGTPAVLISGKLYPGGMPRAKLEALLFR